jgi:hypothetical protein
LQLSTGQVAGVASELNLVTPAYYFCHVESLLSSFFLGVDLCLAEGERHIRKKKMFFL